LAPPAVREGLFVCPVEKGSVCELASGAKAPAHLEDWWTD